MPTIKRLGSGLEGAGFLPPGVLALLATLLALTGTFDFLLEVLNLGLPSGF